MKKTKLWSSILALCCSLLALSFGVYAAVKQVDYTVNGTLSYEVTDAYVEIQTKLYSGTQQLTASQLYQKIYELKDATFSSSPSDLSLVETSTVFSSQNSTSDNNFTPTQTLTFSTDGAMTYFYVINVKNLSSDINVWTIMQDTITSPQNVIVRNSSAILDNLGTNSNGQNIVIGLTIQDATISVEQTANNFSCGITVGTGDLAQQDFNLAKLEAVANDDGKTCSIKPSSTVENNVGVVVVPKTFTIDLASYNVSGFTETRYAWGQLRSAFNTDVCSFDTIIIQDNITNISEGSFRGSGVKSVIIPSTYTSESVLLGVFSGASALEYVNLNDNITTLADSTFSGCTSLTSINLPSKLQSILGGVGTGAFYGSGLTEITIPESVTTISGYAFYGSSNLKDIYLLSTTQITLEAANDGAVCAFDNCHTDLKIHVPYGMGKTYKTATNWSTYADKIVEMSQS